MTLDEAGQALLDACTASGVTVERGPFLAGGPGVALDCRLLAVYLERLQTVPLQAGALARGTCAVVPQAIFRVVFAADCYPVADTDGQNIVLPDPAAITTWTQAFLSDVDALHAALLDVAVPDSFGDDCRNVAVGEGNLTGPLGGMVSIRVPVAFLLAD